MKKLVFFISIATAFIASLHSDNLNDVVANAIVTSSQKYNLETKLLVSLIKTESGFSPFAISLVTSKEKADDIAKELSKNTINNSVYTYHKHKKIISIAPKNKKESVVALQCIKSHGVTRYDLGIAQINSAKIMDRHWSESRILVDVVYNIDKSASILRGCMDMHRNSKVAIECYNKGENAKYIEFDYFKKVKNNYLSLTL